jgi:hypothetical protein
MPAPDLHSAGFDLPPGVDRATRAWRWLGEWTEAFRRGLEALPAWPLLAGILIGFIACCVAGRVVSREKMFLNFSRFIEPIQPQTLFYPTASELVSYVDHKIPRDKILVLVGGASYFRGTGQNNGELWTRELQRLLGSDYAVVNFAIDQAGVTSFAGVAFQILARHYPKMIYVSSGSPVASDAIDGGDVYRYVFWDAYYKGLLPSSSPWGEQARLLARQQRRAADTQELHLGKWTDSLTYSCDLWTFIGYYGFFTVWSNRTVYSPFRARRYYQDADDPNMVQRQQDTRHNLEYGRIMEERGRGFCNSGLTQDPNGKWVPYQDMWDRFAKYGGDMFPDELKPKCLIVLVRGNPYFMQTFTAQDRQNLETIYRLGQDALKRLGFQVFTMSKDYTADDFVDAGHFMPSGGRKLAKEVAAHVQGVFAARQ